MRVVAFVSAMLLSVACTEPPADDGDNDETRVGDPCTSDGNLSDLCPAPFVCVEQQEGAPGGACALSPSCDEDDFCDCDLSSLCGSVPPVSCATLANARLVICTRP